MALSLIPTNTKIDFIGLRRICYAISILMLLIGAISLIYKGGPQYGIDFAGGTVVQVKFAKPVADEAVKNALATTDLPGANAQIFGNPEDGQFLIRIASVDQDATAYRTKILAAFQSKIPGNEVKIERVEAVGPKVGNDLRTGAINALYYASLLIAIYISGRFEQRWLAAGVMAGALIATLYILSLVGVPQMYLIIAATLITLILCWKLKLVYALAAMISLIHDVLFTIGLLSILNIEIDLIIIAALLTVIGYSLNDTIIVFDRIRENLRKKTGLPFEKLINNSVNQTLSRTILTSGTTIMVLLALFFLGGPIIHNFALTMLAGVVIGTYSSIFIASPILLAFGEPPSIDDSEEEEKRIKEIMKQSHDGAVV